MTISGAIRGPCALLLVVLLAGGTILPWPLDSEARTTKEFSNGQREIDLDFPTGTENFVVNISVPRTANLSMAQVGVSGLPLGSVMTYPKSPAIDLSNDGSVDWRYAGQGYGAFGRQQVLSDNSTSGKVVFNGPGTNSSLSVRLPADAKVVTATMRLTGQPYASDWWNQSWLYRLPVTVQNNKSASLGEVVVDIWIDTSDYNVRDQKEFRVFYKPSGGAPEERQSQVVDARMVSGRLTEARVVFRTKALGPNDVHQYFIYFGNSNPPTQPLLTDFKANDIRNRPEVVLYENITDTTPNYFQKPGAITVSGSDLLVADTGHHVVRILDPYGTVKGTLGSFGSPGSDKTHLNSPSGVAVGPDGRIYVSDTGNNRVQVFNPDLSFSMNITDGAYIFMSGNNNLTSPHGIRVLSNGTIVVADTGNHLVQRFKADGSLLDFIGNPGWNGEDNDHFNTPYDVCIREDGFLMVADWNNNRIQIFNSAMKYSSTLGTMGSAMGQFLFPSGVECTGGSVYVADTANHRVQVFTGSTPLYKRQYGQTASSGLGADQLNQPGAVVLDTKGNIFIADSGNNRVLRVTDLGIQFSEPQGIYPDTPTLDIGGDSLSEWTYPGMLVGPISTSEMKVRLNVAIFAAVPKTDKYGNRYVDLPLLFSSKGQGALTVDLIDIQYEIMTLLNITGTVKDAIAKADPMKPSVLIPLKVTAQSGRVRLSNLTMTYDMPPTLIGPIPSTFYLEEDQSNAHLIDLFNYFKDDVDPKENLTFTIVGSTNSSIVGVSIADGHFISVDAFNGTANDFWHGTVEVTVTCTNRRGLTTQFGPFTVTIRHINHRPVFTSAPVTTAIEEQNYTYQAKAEDGDKDKLIYTLAFAPKGMRINESTGLVNWRPEGYQVGVHTVEVQADDGDLLTGRGRQFFNLTVSNVNDQPSVKSTPFTEATVGQDYVYTVIAEDDDNDNLTFSLQKAPKGMKINPTDGTITWKPASGQEGKHSVTVLIFDGTVAVKHEFKVEVKSSGMIGGIPMLYVLLGVGLLLLIIIIVIVAVVVGRRRKARPGMRAKREEARRKASTKRSGKTLEEHIDAEDAVASAGTASEDEEHELKEPEECPKCGDLVEHGLGYCASCGHVMKKDGPLPKQEPEEDAAAKVVTKEDPGPQRGHELSKYQAEESPVEGTTNKAIIVDKDHAPEPKVEPPPVEEKIEPRGPEQEVEPPQEPRVEPEEKVEEEKKDDRSLDDILKALKD